MTPGIVLVPILLTPRRYLIASSLHSESGEAAPFHKKSGEATIRPCSSIRMRQTTPWQEALVP
jgi:hypothetical protein